MESESNDSIKITFSKSETAKDLNYVESLLREEFSLRELKHFRSDLYILVISQSANYKADEFLRTTSSRIFPILGAIGKSSAKIEDFQLITYRDLSINSITLTAEFIALLTTYHCNFAWLLNEGVFNQGTQFSSWQSLATFCVDCINCTSNDVLKLTSIEPDEIIRYRLSDGERAKYQTCYYHIEDNALDPGLLLFQLAKRMDASLGALRNNRDLWDTYFKFGWFLDDAIGKPVVFYLNHNIIHAISSYDCTLDISVYQQEAH